MEMWFAEGHQTEQVFYFCFSNFLNVAYVAHFDRVKKNFNLKHLRKPWQK